MKNNKLMTFLAGIIAENPVLILVLGTCPTLATSTSLTSALSMGLAATVVLIYTYTDRCKPGIRRGNAI